MAIVRTKAARIGLSTALFVSACSSSTTIGTADLEALTSDDLIRECGTAVFPGDVTEPLPVTQPDDEIDQLIAAASKSIGAEFSSFDEEVEWSMATRTDDEIVLLGVGREGDSNADAMFERMDGEWRLSRWGSCHLRQIVPGFQAAPWRFRRNGRPAADDTTAEILVTPECASDPPLSADNTRAIVVPTADRMTITVVGIPDSRVADENGFLPMECSAPSNFVLRVEFPEPAGDRAFHDGAARGGSERS